MTVRRALTASLFLFLAKAVSASDTDTIEALDHQFVAGSIQSDAKAQAALDQTRQVRAQLEPNLKARRVDCQNQFLVNRCLDIVNADALYLDRVVHRITLEVDDRKRSLASHRGHAATQAKAPELGDTRQAQEQHLAAQAQATDQAAEQAKRSVDAKRAEQAEQAAAQAQRAPAREQDAVKAFQEKKADAAQHAKDKAQEKKLNAKKRAERKQKRDAQQHAVPTEISP